MRFPVSQHRTWKRSSSAQDLEEKEVNVLPVGRNLKGANLSNLIAQELGINLSSFHIVAKRKEIV
jgi:hypothetical protein